MTEAGKPQDFSRGQVWAVAELLRLGEDDAAERLWEASGLTADDLDGCEDCDAVPVMLEVLDEVVPLAGRDAEKPNVPIPAGPIYEEIPLDDTRISSFMVAVFIAGIGLAVLAWL